MDLRSAAEYIRNRDTFLIFSHRSPDGDTLGASLALYAGLLLLGKKAKLVCSDSVPEHYAFLPCAENYRLPAEAETCVHAICVDCAAEDRLGDALPLFMQAEDSLNIDHHATNTLYAGINCVETRGAAGELIFELLKELNVPINKEIAECLYTALVTDTGNFAYSSTTAETFRIAAELVETGIDFPELNRMLFHRVPYRKLKLQQIAHAKIRMDPEGLVAVSAISREDMELSGALSGDSEGIVETLRDIETVEVAALLREDGDAVRLSLRSKRCCDVSKIASAFSGGGHKFAAGATLHMPLDEAEKLIYRITLEACNS